MKRTEGFCQLAEMFARVVFSFVIRNSDMMYDRLPVNVVLPEDQEEMALMLNGKKSRLKKQDFMAFANKCDIAENTQ